MKIEFLAKEEQHEELLTYLGVSKRSVGWRYILSCFVEISAGHGPGLEVYEHVALSYESTVARVIRNSQCALVKGRKRKLREWNEIFPSLNIDNGQAWLTLFLRHAAAWLRHNEIAYFYAGHVKYRLPVSKRGKENIV